MITIAKIAQTKGVAVDALCDALNFSRATYYRQQGLKNSDLEPKKPIAMPQNALRDDERQAMLNLMHTNGSSTRHLMTFITRCLMKEAIIVRHARCIGS